MEQEEREPYTVAKLESLELEGISISLDYKELKKVDKAFDYARLFDYQEAYALQTEDKRLPTLKELTEYLSKAGFNSEGPFGLIPDEYYALNLEYPGIEDPILGHVHEGEKLGFWFIENDQGENHVSIDKDELTYQVGRVLPSTKMSVRFILEENRR
jgi:hypothetical protein